MKEKGIMLFFFKFCKVEWRPLLPLLCFQPRISETDNLRQHQVINIQRIYFFIKHMHMLLCRVGFLSFPWTVSCFCRQGNSKQFAHLYSGAETSPTQMTSLRMCYLTDRIFSCSTRPCGNFLFLFNVRLI
ncbi:hypothetical protein HJG60_010909 [Phyllostomus discolor]|uniref:Uncharacterized protein n=1 Tax=Phyllostomus discolor TaxID=89673 RepID=A0A834AEU6_9CHIR|nr:hypothetical protein HJG60_010909 [Phyllostomus discolor]